MGFTKHLAIVLVLALTTLLPFSTLASDMHTTYQAKIIKPDGAPLESTNVNFRFTILDPLGSCILYTENFNTINMAGSGGLVYFSLGSGIKTFPTSGSVSFSDVFNNQGTALSCEVGGPPSYTPAVHDLRKIVMQFHDGTGWQTLPAMAINHVPYAMYAKNAASATTAVNSTQLNGKTDLDFVQVTSIPTCSASQALQFNGASFGCVAVGSGGGGGTVVSVSGAAPIEITGSASAPVISISVASLSSDGYLTAADYAEFKTKLSASSTEIVNTLGYAPVSAAAVTTQIAAAASSANIADTIVKRDSSGNFTANDIFTNAAKTNYVDIYKPSTSFNIRLQASTSLSANYTLVLPDNDGIGGQFLTTDGSGNLSWTSQTTTTISSSDVITALGYTPANSATVSALQSDLSAVSATANNALAKSNNLSDLTSVATARTNLGLGTFATANSVDLGSASATGTIADARLENQSGVTSGTQYTKVTVDGKGRVTSGAQLASSDVATALGYTPAASGSFTSSQWITSSSVVYYGAGNVGIGTTTPVTGLDVSGGVRISMESAICAVSYAGTLRYNAGNVEFCNGSTWTTFGVSGAGLQSLNGSTSGTQTFMNGTAGIAPAFVTVNGIHTLNIPLASAGSVTAGLLSNVDYTTFSNKITSSAASISEVLGYIPASATALGNYLVKANNLSDLTSSATARANLGVGYIGTLSSLASSDVITALGYTPAASGSFTSSQWATSGTTINYTGGNVGIGTANPGQKLSVAGIIESTAGGVKFPDGTTQTSANQPFVIGGTFVGVLANTQVLTQFPFPMNVTIPVGCTNSRFEFSIAATASTVISLQKCTGTGFSSCTQFGTATIAASGKVASFSCAGATSFTAGTDSILITGPGTADITASTAGWAIYGTR